MMNIRFGSALIFAAALTAAACTSAVATPTSPSSATGNTSLTASDFAGTWQLVESQPAGQAAVPTPQGATYRVTFDGNRASTRQDCNVCSGEVVVSGQSITIGPALACTRAACPTMAYETVFESILAGDSSVTMDGRNLTLSSKRGVLRFTR